MLEASPLGGVSLFQVYAWLAAGSFWRAANKVTTKDLTFLFSHRLFQQYETTVCSIKVSVDTEFKLLVLQRLRVSSQQSFLFANPPLTCQTAMKLRSLQSLASCCTSCRALPLTTLTLPYTQFSKLCNDTSRPSMSISTARAPSRDVND